MKNLKNIVLTLCLFVLAASASAQDQHFTGRVGVGVSPSTFSGQLGVEALDADRPNIRLYGGIIFPATDFISNFNLDPKNAGTSVTLSSISGPGSSLDGLGVFHGGQVHSPVVWMWDGHDNAFIVAKRKGLGPVADMGTGDLEPLMMVHNYGKMGLGTTEPIASLDIAKYSNYTGASLGLLARNNKKYWIVAGPSGTAHHLMIGANTGANDLPPTEAPLNIVDDKVAIGTATPNTSPTGLLTVNGDIYAKKVTVKLDITAPDYVFAPEYDLRSLEETEAFIQANKHLPDVPKGTELEENLSLGDMDMALLRKVEELTLYTIEQHKTIKQQEAQMQALLERLTALEAQLEGKK